MRKGYVYNSKIVREGILEKVKQLKRLTDDRFVGDGFYQPKSKEERKEIQDMYKPSYKEIYDRLAEYERRFSNG